MSDEHLLKAIASIRKSWQLESRVQDADQELKQKELDHLDSQLDKLKSQSQSILDQANQDAEDLLQDARDRATVFLEEKEEENNARRAELEQEYEQRLAQADAHVQSAKEQEEKGFGEGHDKGFQAGYQEGMQKFQEMISDFEAIITEIQSQRRGLLESHRQELDRFILAYIEKILGPLCELETSHIMANIEKSLQELHRATRIKVVVSPYDYEALQAMQTEFKSLFSATKDVQLLEDSNVSPGGCYLETELGNVDATIESQVALLRREMVGHDGSVG